MSKEKEQVQEQDQYVKIYNYLKRVKHYYLRTLIFNAKMILRSKGLADIRYKNIKSIKGIHNGEKCFIIATGPSLTTEDINKLKNEITFGMNSLCKVFNDIGWETTYYGIQDYLVYDKLKGEIKNIKNSTIFIGDIIKDYKNLNSKTYVYPLHMLNHLVTFEDLTIKFSDDCYMKVYDGYTITYSLIQIAIYMGFKEIYLIGCDCNYESGKPHHFIEYDHVDPTFDTAKKRMLVGYQEAKKYADRNNIKIYNATRGGQLEVFPRVDLDEVLGLKNK